jgi:hypothetical protein
VSICNDKTLNQTGAPYKFNITTTGPPKLLIPLAGATCLDIGNKTGQVVSQGLPGAPFGSYQLTGPSNLQMSLMYDRIRLDGDMKIGQGSNKVCFRKIGQDGTRILINVTNC